jgi:hypothetical protein
MTTIYKKSLTTNTYELLIYDPMTYIHKTTLFTHTFILIVGPADATKLSSMHPECLFAGPMARSQTSLDSSSFTQQYFFLLFFSFFSF